MIKSVPQPEHNPAAELEENAREQRLQDPLKQELYEWVFEAFGRGLTSPTQLGRALELSAPRIVQILEDLGLHKHRQTLEQHLSTFPVEFQIRLKVLNQSRKAARSRKRV